MKRFVAILLISIGNLSCISGSSTRPCDASKFERRLNALRALDFATLTPSNLRRQWGENLYAIGDETAELSFLSTAAPNASNVCACCFKFMFYGSANLTHAYDITSRSIQVQDIEIDRAAAVAAAKRILSTFGFSDTEIAGPEWTQHRTPITVGVTHPEPHGATAVRTADVRIDKDGDAWYVGVVVSSGR
jgi:hypothetical protein